MVRSSRKKIAADAIFFRESLGLARENAAKDRLCASQTAARDAMLRAYRTLEAPYQTQGQPRIGRTVPR